MHEVDRKWIRLKSLKHDGELSCRDRFVHLVMKRAYKSDASHCGLGAVSLTLNFLRFGAL